MSENNPQQAPEETNLRVPAPIATFARLWNNISSSLVPFLAVITAFLFGIPLIMLTVGISTPGRGLQVSGQAYAALVEGLTGIAVSDVADINDFRHLITYSDAIEIGEPGRQQLGIERINSLGLETVQSYQESLAPYPNLLSNGVDDVVEILPNINNMADDLDNEVILSQLNAITNFMDGEFITALAGEPSLILRGREGRQRASDFDDLVDLGAQQTELTGNDLEEATELSHC